MIQIRGWWKGLALIALVLAIGAVATRTFLAEDSEPAGEEREGSLDQIDLGGGTLPQLPAEAESNPASAELGIDVLEMITNASTSESDFDWVTRHDLASWVPRYNFAPQAFAGLATVDERIPKSFGSLALVRVIKQGSTSFLFYGGHFIDASATNVVFALDHLEARPRFGVDLGNLSGFSESSQPPEITWAIEAGNLFIVKDDSSLTAIDVEGRRIPWRQEGVSAALTFDKYGGLIFSGCCGLDSGGGGDSIPVNSVYVLDARTGTILQEIQVDSPPKILFVKDQRLFVRTIDMEWVFRIKAP